MISHCHRCICAPECASQGVLERFAAHGVGHHSFRPATHGGPISLRIRGTARAMNLNPNYFTGTFLRSPYEQFVALWPDLRRVARERGRERLGGIGRAGAGRPSTPFGRRAGARSGWPGSRAQTWRARAIGIRRNCDCAHEKKNASPSGCD